MKRIILYIVFLMMSSVLLASNVDLLVDSARNSFMQSRYVDALTIYDSICNMGYSSSDLYYNMGNCYYRLSQVPQSIYYYEKALMLDPSNSDAEFNLNIVNRMLKQNVETLPVPFYSKWWASVLNLMSSDAWTILNIVMLLIFFVGFATFLFFRGIRIRKLGLSIAVISLFFFVFSAICAYNSSVRINQNRYGIMFEQSMVKSSPNADAVNSFEVCEGLKVLVSDSANGMYNIRLADGKEGWVDMLDIKMLAE